MYTVRFTQQYKIVLALIAPAVIIVPAIYAVAKFLPNLPDTAVGLAMVVIMCVPIAITFWLIKRSTPIVEMTIGNNVWQFHFTNPGFLTPNDFELNLADINSFSVEVARNGHYFTIGSNTAPHSFSISAASNSEEDNNKLLKLIEKITTIIDTKNNTPIEKKVTVTAFRNMRWFWAMIIFNVIFFVVMMIVQLVKG